MKALKQALPLAQNRDYVIDNTKLICLFLILFCHIPPMAGHFHAAILLFHVPVFFLISGLFFKNGSYSEVIKASARTLLLPYFIFNLFLIIISCCIVTIGHYEFTVKTHIVKPLIGVLLGSTLPNAPFKIPGGPSWFLIALFIDRVIFSIFLHAKKPFKVILCIILLLTFICLYNYNTWCLYSFDSALLGLPFMAIGYFLKDKISLIRGLPIPMKITLIVVLSIALYVISAINGISDMFAGKYGEYFVLFIIGGIVGSALIYLVCTFLNTSNRITRLFIKGSTFFICMHIMVMEYVSLVYKRSLNVGDDLLVLDKIIISIITVALIYVALVLINRFCPRLLKP